jgi:hypothetical protein
MSADLISRFGRPVIVQSSPAGSYVDGIWVEPVRTNSTIIASVQPMTPKEVMLLPEGDRQKEAMKLYSTYQFKTQKDGTMETSDYVLIDGRTYMVIACTDFVVHNAMKIRYYRGDCVSVNPKSS